MALNVKALIPVLEHPEVTQATALYSPTLQEDKPDQFNTSPDSRERAMEQWQESMLRRKGVSLTHLLDVL
ncbi:MAG: hypothetical protein CME71_09890 [Halobacteriovorax sp.]|nr:hypothetical protein [Halobacteriovorax sp.]|tara:strand:+ start:507 stop:716 length:210 start_codon:yes stop_codon:yes gene_type:complete